MFTVRVKLGEGNAKGTKCPMLTVAFGMKREEDFGIFTVFRNNFNRDLVFFPVNDLGESLILRAINTTIHL